MFIGHFALGFGAKRLAPTVSIGTLFLACQLADLVWPNLVLVGIEELVVAPGDTAYTPLAFVSYPYSHSLLGVTAAAVLLALFHGVVRRSGWRTLLVLALLVVSHWLLDALSHRPDLPLTPRGDARVGLGLWNSVPATVLVESALFGLGVAVYVRCTEPRDRVGTLALVGLVGFLALVSVASALGPPPPGPAAVAWTAQSMWLLVAWGYWVDRHRCARVEPAS